MRKVNWNFVGAIFISLLIWIALFLLFCSCCEAQEEDPDAAFRMLKQAYYNLYIMDTGLTLSLMEKGGYVELNPFWRPFISQPQLVMVIDMGVMIGTNYLFNELHKWNKPLSYITMGILIATQAYVVQNQWRLAWE